MGAALAINLAMLIGCRLLQALAGAITFPNGVALSNLAMYVTLLAVPILLTTHLHWPPSWVGLTLAALSVMSLVCAPIGGRWADTLGRTAPVVAGLGALTLGCILVGIAQARLLPLLIAGLILMGAGLGIAGAGMQTVAIEAVSKRIAGTAAGLFSTSRYCGSIIGSTVWTVLIGAEKEQFTVVFVMVFAAAMLSLVAAVVMQPRLAAFD